MRVRVPLVKKFLGRHTQIFADIKEGLHGGKGLFIFNRPLAKIGRWNKIENMKYEKIAEYSNTKFRRITGVKRATFDKMAEILHKGYAQKHQRRGRTPKLSIEDLLLATLEYLREYRTYAHIAASYGKRKVISTGESRG